MISQPFLRRLEPWARRVVLIALALLAVAVIGGVRSCQAARTAKIETRLATGQAEAALESGADAVGTVGAVGAGEVRIDVITRENENAIRQAPGADAPVDPAVHAAGLAGLCRYAAYRQHPDCVQQPPAE